MMIGQFEKVCRERGIATTHQRRVIFEVVFGRSDHPSPELVCDEVRQQIPSISVATVYKNLKLFVEIGLLQEVSYPGSRAARYDANLEDHQHLVCSRCTQMIDVTIGGLKALRIPHAQASAFESLTPKIYFEGVCEECRSRQAVFPQLRAGRPGKTDESPLSKGTP